MRWSWRWERGTWEVPVGGLREMNFFWEGFRAREVVIEKMTGKPLTNRLCCHLHRGRMGIWKRVKFLYFVGGKFCRYEILNFAKVQV